MYARQQPRPIPKPPQADAQKAGKEIEDPKKPTFSERARTYFKDKVKPFLVDLKKKSIALLEEVFVDPAKEIWDRPYNWRGVRESYRAYLEDYLNNIMNIAFTGVGNDNALWRKRDGMNPFRGLKEKVNLPKTTFGKRMKDTFMAFAGSNQAWTQEAPPAQARFMFLQYQEPKKRSFLEKLFFPKKSKAGLLDHLHILLKAIVTTLLLACLAATLELNNLVLYAANWFKERAATLFLPIWASLTALAYLIKVALNISILTAMGVDRACSAIAHHVLIPVLAGIGTVLAAPIVGIVHLVKTHQEKVRAQKEEKEQEKAQQRALAERQQAEELWAREQVALRAKDEARMRQGQQFLDVDEDDGMWQRQGQQGRGRSPAFFDQPPQPEKKTNIFADGDRELLGRVRAMCDELAEELMKGQIGAVPVPSFRGRHGIACAMQQDEFKGPFISVTISGSSQADVSTAWMAFQHRLADIKANLFEQRRGQQQRYEQGVVP